MLPRLAFKLIGRQSFTPSTGAGAIATSLQALQTLLASTTYYDGSARTPGVGQAWSSAQEGAGAATVAVYGQPPAGSPIASGNFRFIIAGSTAGAPTMTRDTFIANGHLAAMAKNAGAYTTWTAASPFTVGQFSGFVRGSGSAFTFLGWWAWECDEVLILALENQSSGAPVHFFVFGAEIEPASTDPAQAESNGRLYSFATGGNGEMQAAAQTTTNSTAMWRTHRTNANQPAHYVFAPGSSGTLRTATSFYNYSDNGVSVLDNNTYKDLYGRINVQPLVFADLAGTGRTLGRGRAMFAGPKAHLGGAWVSGERVQAWALSSTGAQTGQNEAWWIYA